MPERTTMAGLHESGSSAVSSALELFTGYPEENRIRARRSCQAKPINGIQGDGPFDILIPSEKKSFIDPSSFRICGKFCIKKIDSGRNITALPTLEGTPEALPNIPVTPVNLLTKSIFRDIEVELENQKITLNSSPTYPIKAYVHTLTSYGDAAVRGHLHCSRWKADSPGVGDNLETNKNALLRYGYINGSRVVSFCDNLHTELTTTSRYLLPGIECKFRFIIEEPGHFLLGKKLTAADGKVTVDDHVIEFQDLYLTFDRITLKDAELASIERTLATTPAVYPITRTEIRTKGFAPGMTTLEWYNAYQGNIPDQIIIAMNSQEAADGKKLKNKFNFQHYYMRNFSLIVNSVRLPTPDLEFKFGGETDCYDAYRHFYDNIGVDISNAPTLLDYKSFVGGTTLIPFDLTTDRCALFHGHEKKPGNVSLEIKLGRGTSEAVNVYMICFYKDQFFVTGTNENRKVSLNYPTKI